MKHQRLFEAAALRPAGRYGAGAFEIAAEWRPRRAVYVWTHGGGPDLQPIRVGIACGPTGLGGRFDHYNKWLAGRFKADDPREQKVRSVFLQGLKNAADVWAVPVPDKPAALALESTLRSAWGQQLALDLMVRNSWGKLQMNAWRDAGRPPATVIWPPSA